MTDMETLVAERRVGGRIGRLALDGVTEGAPDWLAGRRAEAWEQFERLPMPSTRSEEWRYTDVGRKLALDELTMAVPSGDSIPALLRQTMDQDRESSGRVTEVDGVVQAVELSPGLEEQGVILRSLAEAAAEGEELLELYLATEAVPRYGREVRGAERRALGRRRASVRPQGRAARRTRSTESVGLGGGHGGLQQNPHHRRAG